MASITSITFKEKIILDIKILWYSFELKIIKLLKFISEYFIELFFTTLIILYTIIQLISTNEIQKSTACIESSIFLAAFLIYSGLKTILLNQNKGE